MRGADVARVARSPPAAAVGRASVRAICAAAGSCASTPSTTIAPGKLIDRQASSEPSIKPATPRIAVVRRQAGARSRWAVFERADALLRKALANADPHRRDATSSFVSRLFL